MGPTALTRISGETDTHDAPWLRIHRRAWAREFERDILTNATQDGETVQLLKWLMLKVEQIIKETIQDLMNIHIDRYAMINKWKVFVQLVDKVGGITVNNPFWFDISMKKIKRKT